VTTVVRGTIVYDRGEIVGSPGYGQIVRPGVAKASSEFAAVRT
jgi:hypothetical protein